MTPRATTLRGRYGMLADKQDQVRAARREAQRRRRSLLEETTARTLAKSRAQTSPKKSAAWGVGGKGAAATTARTTELRDRAGHGRAGVSYRVIDTGYDWVLLAINGRPQYVPQWATKGVSE